MAKRKTQAEALILGVFAREHSHCWLCGIAEGQRDSGSSYGSTLDYRRLQIHHISKLGRRHEGWNLSRLCELCHMIVEGHVCRNAAGVAYPQVSNANVFWLKKFCDRRLFDWPAIVGSWRNGMPDSPVRPDGVYENMFLRNRGCIPLWSRLDSL